MVAVWQSVDLRRKGSEVRIPMIRLNNGQRAFQHISHSLATSSECNAVIKESNQIIKIDLFINLLKHNSRRYIMSGSNYFLNDQSREFLEEIIVFHHFVHSQTSLGTARTAQRVAMAKRSRKERRVMVGASS